jgi:hypothetical protein
MWVIRIYSTSYVVVFQLLNVLKFVMCLVVASRGSTDLK